MKRSRRNWPMTLAPIWKKAGRSPLAATLRARSLPPSSRARRGSSRPCFDGARIAAVEPRLECGEGVIAAKKATHKVRCIGRAARRQDAISVACRCLSTHGAALLELLEQVLLYHQGPHVRVVEGRVVIEVSKACLKVGAVHESKQAVLVLKLRYQTVRVQAAWILSIAFQGDRRVKH